MAERLRVFFDVPEERILEPGMGTWTFGKVRVGTALVDGWPVLSNAYVEPSTGLLMRMPAAFDPEWTRQTAGIYARTPLASFTQVDLGSDPATGWTEVSSDVAGDRWLQGENLPGGAELVLPGFPADRSIFFACRLFNAGSDQAKAVEIFWGGEVNPAPVSLRIYHSGEIQIWIGGSLAASGSVNGGQRSQSVASGTLGILVMPMERQIGVFSTLGGSLIAKREDIDPDDTTTPTLPGGELVFEHEGVTGSKAFWQIQAPAKFHPSGYAVSVPFELKRAPEASEAAIPDFYATGATPTVRVVEENATNTNFAPNGVKKRGRIRVEMAGADTETVTVYAAGARWLPVMQTHEGPEAEVERENWKPEGLSLTFGDRPADNLADLVVVNPDGITSPENVEQYGRSHEVRLGDLVLIQGHVGAKEREYLFISQEAEQLPLVLNSLWQRLAEDRPDHTLVFDGLTLTEAFGLIAEQAGIGDRIRVSEDPFRLEREGQGGGGQFSLTQPAGEPFAAAFDRLRSDFCATWFMGMELVPGELPRLAILSPEDLEDTPAVTVYFSHEDADRDGEGEEAQFIRVVREWKESRLEPEATQIWVSGRDPYTGLPLPVFHRRRDLEDATLAPGDRGRGWLGRPRVYGLEDPAITNERLAIRAVEKLRDRLTKERVVASCASGWWIDSDGVPIIEGRLIESKRWVEGAWEVRKWRVRKVQVTSIVEPSEPSALFSAGLAPGGVLRTARYVMEEELEDEPDTKGGGLANYGQSFDAGQIARAQKMRLKYAPSLIKRAREGQLIEWSKATPRRFLEVL